VFNVGDVCSLRIAGMEHIGTFEVIIRGPGNDYEYEYTVEFIGPRDQQYATNAFHPCHDGPIRFDHRPVGRWVNSKELTLIRRAERQPTKFAKFIRSIEDRHQTTK